MEVILNSRKPLIIYFSGCVAEEQQARKMIFMVGYIKGCADGGVNSPQYFHIS